MNRLLISYDLIAPGRYYEPLFDYIKSFPKFAKPLESLWLIKTSKNYETVRDKLIRLIDSNDKILVIDITGDAASWHNIPKSSWIRNSQ